MASKGGSKHFTNIVRNQMTLKSKVQPTQPFQIIYSLFEHQYLGFVIEPFVVQLNSKNELTECIQSVSAKNVREFEKYSDEIDFKLVEWADYLQQEFILKKYNNKKLPVYDFFVKTFDKSPDDDPLKKTIKQFVENTRADILANIFDKRVFMMGNDGNPIWREIQPQHQKAKVYFHFNRQEDKSTHYFPIMRHGGERVVFQSKSPQMLCDSPAFLLVNQKLYHFDNKVDGKKLRPFFTKNHIVVPANMEDTYYAKFVVPLVASFDVFANGFEIKTESHLARPTIIFSENTLIQSDLFQNENQVEKAKSLTFDLFFEYGNHKYRFDSFAAAANVSLQKTENSWIVKKIKRDLEFEKNIIKVLKDTQLDLRSGRATMPKYDAFEWLEKNRKTLIENRIEWVQEVQNEVKYFTGESSIDIKIQEEKDWFDVNAVVYFGSFEIPFIKLKDHILNKKKEFVLPDGTIAILPDFWFSKFADLFSFADLTDSWRLGKHHVSLVQGLDAEGLATAIMDRKLSQLSQNFKDIEVSDLPVGFEGELRPYQKAGYDWFCFLDSYGLGGCLADDMGLGKTVQALAFLQQQIEQNPGVPNLVVMPTSLIFNWTKEAGKFTPNLRVLTHAGPLRQRNSELFSGFDLIFTTYGTLRLDIDFIKNFRFNYVILDESQAIKNPGSMITKAVMGLNSRNRLVLTGTPLENTTMDLWTQMTFTNPGLLGSQNYFRNEYQIPIEKHQDIAKTKKMFGLIKPFMLRRHKKQVATELPPKVEDIVYCTMTTAQEKAYEEEKSYYRNIILDSLDDKGVAKSQVVLLQGLAKLRQIANHPSMVESDYLDDSGKFEEVIDRVETLIESGHKTLIFSQFVKHLALFKDYLQKAGIDFCYIDGSVSAADRMKETERFQNDASVKIFLISLKAGGTGLNLTAAEYVMILDPWWNPAVEAQAIDRAHRIGQQNTVFAYKFITKNTVEEKILTLQRNKKQLFNDLIATEETFVKSLSKEDILALLD